MNLFTNLKIAAKIFETHKTRTLLSVLGVLIGIMSVIAIINAGESLRYFIQQQVEVFGTDYIEIEVKVPSTSQASRENAGGIAQGISITTLKMDDAYEILEHPNIDQVYGGMLGQEVISYQGVNKTGSLWGVSSGFFEIDKNELIQGRPFNKSDDNSLSQIVVLGYQIKQDLFGTQNPIGRKIKIGNKKFKVIGVREKIGGGSFIDFDDMIIMPIQTLQKKVLGVDHVSFIMAGVKDMSLVEKTSAEVTHIMRREHDILDPDKDDFAVVSSKEAMEMLDTILNAMTIFLVAIAAISLIVGGVGIMNIMYVSVIERTYEIGLRKAIGARRSDILIQFLSESVLVTVIGGIVGVATGIALSWFISYLAGLYGIQVKFIISFTGIIIATLFMVLTGLIFGFFPARKASYLNPVEALRYE